jgi:hypothetical protein
MEMEMEMEMVIAIEFGIYRGVCTVCFYKTDCTLAY